ncbi:VirB8/TrbF family protein, partial [Komagataeibacter sp. NFXK3]
MLVQKAYGALTELRRISRCLLLLYHRAHPPRVLLSGKPGAVHYRDGAFTGTERWTAIVSIVLRTPRDADHLRKNPLGIYVSAINWSKELGQ